MPRRTLRSLLFVLCIAVVTGHAAAEPSPPALTSNTLQDTTHSIERIKRDASGRPAYLARFSDGPRHVPVARGVAKARADRLGLGGHEVTRTFLWTRPSAELLAEVHGEMPKNLLWPVVDGHYGRGFGYTRILRPELHHNGIDIGAEEGAVVRAAADGLVVYSDNGLTGYGNCVMILHANGWLTLYAHNQRATVQPGWRVKRGERIALVGRTGYAWGPHLHFELRDNGRLRDPKPLITGWKSDEVNGPLVMLEGELPPPAARDTTRDEEAPTPAQPATAHAPSATKTEPAASEAPSIDRLLRDGPTDEEAANAGGRVFRNLLWPVKDGALRTRHGRVELVGARGSAVRAAADGIVMHSGQAPRGYYGNVVVLLHPNGWLTVYSGVDELGVKQGERVLRGQWIAHVAQDAAPVRFEWRVGGKTQDRDALLAALVGAP